MAILRHPNAIATAMTINPSSFRILPKFLGFDQADAFGAEQVRAPTLFRQRPRQPWVEQ